MESAGLRNGSDVSLSCPGPIPATVLSERETSRSERQPLLSATGGG